VQIGLDAEPNDRSVHFLRGIKKLQLQPEKKGYYVRQITHPLEYVKGPSKWDRIPKIVPGRLPLPTLNLPRFGAIFFQVECTPKARSSKISSLSVNE
jgi:hypothetical protein